MACRAALALLLLGRAAGVDRVRVIAQPHVNLTALREGLAPLGAEFRRAPAFMHETMAGASLLNRVLYAHDAIYSGKQVFTAGQVGVYRAHVAVWEEMPPDETWLVLESDMVALPETVGLIAELEAAAGAAYDYLNLVPTNVVHNAEPSPVTPLLRECPPGDHECQVMGACAYLVTGLGARKLLRHATPIEMPLDWYVTTMHDFSDASFRMAFTDRGFFGSLKHESLVGHVRVRFLLPETADGVRWFLLELSLGCLALGVLGTLACGLLLRGSPCGAAPPHDCPSDDPEAAAPMLAAPPPDAKGGTRVYEDAP